MAYPATAAAPLESSAVAPTTCKSHTRKTPGKTTRRQPGPLHLTGNPLGFRRAGRHRVGAHLSSPSSQVTISDQPYRAELAKTRAVSRRYTRAATKANPTVQAAITTHASAGGHPLEPRAVFAAWTSQ